MEPQSRTVYVVARSKEQAVRCLMGSGDRRFGAKTFIHKGAAKLEAADLGEPFRVFHVTLNAEVGDPLALPRKRARKEVDTLANTRDWEHGPAPSVPVDLGDGTIHSFPIPCESVHGCGHQEAAHHSHDGHCIVSGCKCTGYFVGPPT